MKNLIDILDLSVNEIDELIDTANDIRRNIEKNADIRNWRHCFLSLPRARVFRLRRR